MTTRRAMTSLTYTVLSCAVLLALNAVISQPTRAGEFDRAVRGLGRATGIKPLEKAGEEMGDAWKNSKKALPVIQDIQHLTSDQVRDAGRWAKEHPEEVIAIAAVAAVGWAACVDGCTLIAGVVLEGASAGGAAAFVPVVAVATADKPDDGSSVRAIPPPPATENVQPPAPPSNDPSLVGDPGTPSADAAPSATPDGASGTPPAGTPSPDVNSSPTPASGSGALTSTLLPDGSPIAQVPGAPGAVVATSTTPYLEQGLKAEYPRYISLSDTGSGAPTIVYRSLDQRLSEVTNQFSVPVYPGLVRLPNKSDDVAGGTFLSRRNDLGSGPEASAAATAFGSDARRLHGGLDFIAVAGQPVMAPMSGKIARIDIDAGHGLKGVEIVSDDGTKARVLYVVSSSGLEKDEIVIAGQTRIGTAADIGNAYKGVVNHVHVDFTDLHGRRFDPWTNTFLDPKQQ